MKEKKYTVKNMIHRKTTITYDFLSNCMQMRRKVKFKGKATQDQV